MQKHLVTGRDGAYSLCMSNNIIQLAKSPVEHNLAERRAIWNTLFIQFLNGKKNRNQRIFAKGRATKAMLEAGF